MRIAFDAKRAFNNGTGLGNYARLLLNALMRGYPEHEYQLYTAKMKDRYFNQLHGDYKLIFPDSKLHQTFPALWRSSSIVDQLKWNKVQIYHGLSNEIPVHMDFSGIKTVVTIHDLIFLKHTEQYPWIDRQIYKNKTKYATREADRIIAVSEETKQDLVELYKIKPRNIDVVYQSANPIFYNPVSVEEKIKVRDNYSLPNKYILNVGSFYPRKNQERLIKAFDIIKHEVEEGLVLVGNTGNIKQIVELVTAKKLQQRIHIVSNVTNDDMPALYQQASLFVFPSLFEGFGVPVLEALFSRTPVVATKGGAIEEAAGKHSLLINPTSVDEMADSMLKVLKNEPLRQQMIITGYAHAMTMTDTAFAANTMKVYEGLY